MGFDLGGEGGLGCPAETEESVEKRRDALAGVAVSLLGVRLEGPDGGGALEQLGRTLPAAKDGLPSDVVVLVSQDVLAEDLKERNSSGRFN